MKFPRQVFIGLLAALGGILGNLIAAFIQGSWGRFTYLQALFMVASILLVIIFSTRLERSNAEESLEVSALQNKLRHLRNELGRAKARHESGVSWTFEDTEEWQQRQREIEGVKFDLRQHKIDTPYEYIDNLPPPRISLLVRAITNFKLFRSLVLFIFALLFAVLGSAATQAAIVTIFDIPVIDTTPTPTPSIIRTPVPQSTPTIELDSFVTPTATISVLDGSITPAATVSVLDNSFTPAATVSVLDNSSTPAATTSLSGIVTRVGSELSVTPGLESPTQEVRSTTQSVPKPIITLTPTATDNQVVTFISPQESDLILGDELKISWEGELGSEDDWFTVEVHAQGAFKPKIEEKPWEVAGRMVHFSGPIRQNEWTVDWVGDWECEGSSRPCSDITLRPGGMQVYVLRWSTSSFKNYISKHVVGFYWYN